MRLILFFSLCFLFLSPSISKGQQLTREQRISIESKLFVIRLSSNPTEVLRLADQILKIDSLNLVAVAYQAVAYYHLKEYAISLRKFNLYLEKKPNSSFCLFRAQLKTTTGDTTGALLDIEKAFNLSGYDTKITDMAANFFRPDKRLIKYYEKVIKLHPDNYMAYTVLAAINEQEKDYEGASQKYSTAIKYLDSELFSGKRIQARWIYKSKARVEFIMKHYSEASKTISEVILLFSGEPKYYKERAICYLIGGEKNKGCADMLFLKKFGKNISEYDKVECDSSNIECKLSKEWLIDVEASKLYIEGFAVPRGLDSVNNNKAVSYFSKALELKPNYVYALAGRVQRNSFLNKPEIMLSDLDKIIKINPKNAEVYNLKARANTDIGNYKEALKDINKAILMDSSDVAFWDRRASIECLMGDTTKAIYDLSKAIQLNPYYSQTYYRRAELELKYKLNGNPTKALSDNLKAIEIEENNPTNFSYSNYYYNCALSYDQLKIYDKALIYMEKAIAIQPDIAIHYYRCGEIKARLKDMKGACEDWNKAKQLGYSGAEELILYNCK